MPEAADDIDELQNSLTKALGAGTLVILSSDEEDRQFLGAEALAAYAIYLLVKFATAFAEEFKKRLNKDVDKAGKIVADAVYDRLKAVACKTQPFGDGKPESRKESAATAVQSIKKVKGITVAKATLEEAIKEARSEVTKELVVKGFSKEEADAKADKFVETILSGLSK